MHSLVYIIFEAVILASALSIDAFVACFAYGSKNIKIPFTSVQVINIVWRKRQFITEGRFLRRIT